MKRNGKRVLFLIELREQKGRERERKIFTRIDRAEWGRESAALLPKAANRRFPTPRSEGEPGAAGQKQRHMVTGKKCGYSK